MDKLANQQDPSDLMDRNNMMARLRERDQLAGQRQQLSGDLSKLQKSVRDSARELASNQPGAAQKLRDALTEMDQSNLDNHVQRTADWLRGEVNPNSNGTENEIAQGFQKLSRHLRQAQQEIAQGKPGLQGAARGDDETAALDQIERLRNHLEAMATSRRGNGQRDKNGQSGQQGQNSRTGQKDNSQGQANGRGPQPGLGQEAGDRTGLRSGQSGDVRYGGGGGADGTVWGNINTGNNSYGHPGQRPTPADASNNPADTERNYQQGMRELSQLRQMVQDDPQTTKQVQELAKQMQRLDPSRFPGNPALVEQMHSEVLNSIDRIELQLQRDGATTEARTGKPYAVPAGYQDSVAEYYRRLSKNP